MAETKTAAFERRVYDHEFPGGSKHTTESHAGNHQDLKGAMGKHGHNPLLPW